MKKAVLNTTSTKKRDVMLAVSNTTPLGQPQLGNEGFRTGPIYVRGGPTDGLSNVNGAVFVWSPTQRPINDNTVSENTRSTRDVYHKGFRERMRVESSSATPWIWRRIVVETKEDDFRYDAANEDFPNRPPRGYLPWYQGPGGISRLWYNQYGNRELPSDTRIDEVINAVTDRLFEGQQGTDWTDTLDAKPDRDRYTVRYDRKFTLSSHNDEGFVRKLNFYHPFESTMYYDHDEAGGGTGNQSVVCTQSKKGMGNIYIIDIIEGGFSSDDTDILRISSEAVTYWHER